MTEARGRAPGGPTRCAPTLDERQRADAEQRASGARDATTRRAESVAEPTSSARATRSAGGDWRTLLAGASPREVLARLTSGDPLALRNVVAARLADQAYLLDADRVWLRAVARVARFSTRYRGEPVFERWLRSQVDDAILDCVENGDAPPSGEAGVDERESSRSTSFETLARPLGLSAQRMRAACAAFNACEPRDRRAFFALVLEREELEPAAARMELSPTECARAARRALEAVMEAAIRPEPANPPPSERRSSDHGPASESGATLEGVSSDSSGDAERDATNDSMDEALIDVADDDSGRAGSEEELQ